MKTERQRTRAHIDQRGPPPPQTKAPVVSARPLRSLLSSFFPPFPASTHRPPWARPAFPQGRTETACPRPTLTRYRATAAKVVFRRRDEHGRHLIVCAPSRQVEGRGRKNAQRETGERATAGRRGGWLFRFAGTAHAFCQRPRLAVLLPPLSLSLSLSTQRISVCGRRGDDHPRHPASHRSGPGCCCCCCAGAGERVSYASRGRTCQHACEPLALASCGQIPTNRVPLGCRAAAPAGSPPSFSGRLSVSMPACVCVCVVHRRGVCVWTERERGGRAREGVWAHTAMGESDTGGNRLRPFPAQVLRSSTVSDLASRCGAERPRGGGARRQGTSAGRLGTL